MNTGTTTIADQIEDAMRASDWRALTGLYAVDVLLDVNLPTWRFQLQGREAASRYFVEETAGFRNLHTTHLAVHPIAAGLVVEEEMRFDSDDGEYLWRAVDIFHLDQDRITQHIEYCTGCWPPSQIARQADEAPMVRW